MLAVKFFDCTGVTADAQRRKDELHLAKACCHVRVGHEDGVQLGGWFAGVTLKKFRRAHDTHTGLAIGKWNNPNPGAGGMDTRPNLSALTPRGTLVAGD